MQRYLVEFDIGSGLLVTVDTTETNDMAIAAAARDILTEDHGVTVDNHVRYTVELDDDPALPQNQ